MSVDEQRESRRFTPNRYYDINFKCMAVKLLPGEYYATTDHTMIVTVLGSCVSVCLRDPKVGVAGMNHFLLPSDGATAISIVSESARYGVYAMELLINQMLELGADKRRLEAKVFGGGRVIRGMTSTHVGERNAEFVLDYLSAEHIPVLASDLLDEFPRKVYFFPDSGNVSVRKLKSLHNTTIIDRESEYRMRVRRSAMSGDIDLFE